jgi:acetylornithine deacetylase/succinyl-diaminopimelate desuccinylase-like protein
MEGEDLPTVLTYGHGDTVLAMDGRWREGLEPWQVIQEGERWYGRGAADNKGRHAINLAALACVLEKRQLLGFNVKVLIEMGEEMGSPGLHQICAMEKEALAELEVTGREGPEIDPDWGEPGLSPAEKVYGWNTLEVLAFECGTPAAPVHAIPPSAWARMHMRFVAGCSPDDFIPAVPSTRPTSTCWRPSSERVCK